MFVKVNEEIFMNTAMPTLSPFYLMKFTSIDLDNGTLKLPIHQSFLNKAQENIGAEISNTEIDGLQLALPETKETLANSRLTPISKVGSSHIVKLWDDFSRALFHEQSKLEDYDRIYYFCRLIEPTFQVARNLINRFYDSEQPVSVLAKLSEQKPGTNTFVPTRSVEVQTNLAELSAKIFFTHHNVGMQISVDHTGAKTDHYDLIWNQEETFRFISGANIFRQQRGAISRLLETLFYKFIGTFSSPNHFGYDLKELALALYFEHFEAGPGSMELPKHLDIKQDTIKVPLPRGFMEPVTFKEEKVIYIYDKNDPKQAQASSTEAALQNALISVREVQNHSGKTFYRIKIGNPYYDTTKPFLLKGVTKAIAQDSLDRFKNLENENN